MVVTRTSTKTVAIMESMGTDVDVLLQSSHHSKNVCSMYQSRVLKYEHYWSVKKIHCHNLERASNEDCLDDVYENSFM